MGAALGTRQRPAKGRVETEAEGHGPVAVVEDLRRHRQHPAVERMLDLQPEGEGVDGSRRLRRQEFVSAAGIARRDERKTAAPGKAVLAHIMGRSEEHTSELQSL